MTGLAPVGAGALGLAVAETRRKICNARLLRISFVNWAIWTSVASTVETEKSMNITGISLYSRIPMGTWALIPRVDYDFSNSEMDKWDDLTLSVAGRFTF